MQTDFEKKIWGQNLRILKSQILLIYFWGDRRGWQPDKVYFIHSETCNNYIINFHEHKTCLSKRLSTEKEKTSILDVIQSYYINKRNNSFF